MTPIPYAEHLPVFVAVARAGSFSAVAARQGVAPSSVVRQIDVLEAALGVRLFARSTRGLALTDAGELLLARVPALIDELVDLRAEVASLGDEPRGVLRVACLPTFGRHHVLPLLPDLLARYPALRIELEFTERLADPVRERLDAVIRMGPLKDSRLYAQRLATQRWSICASRAYLDRHGHPATLAELAGHRLLDKRHDPEGLGWRGLRAAGLIPGDAADSVLACDDFEALLLAAIAGLGLAYLPTWVTEQATSSGQLVTVFDNPAQREDDVHLLRALPRPSAKLAVFAQALLAALDAGQNRLPLPSVDSRPPRPGTARANVPAANGLP
ncbi:LysR family transcriptional regulator [Burkholderia ubonensis]|uniref:LysR family transcriptional regulator n=1 Tax=Burkholderia ubonensis TaxID=101571 RepID=UPI00076D4156|nr:LysR family transcriptional regulator [Burkholderia ubonensis]KWC58143.1 LysR family transcriptional regulator [Burkholderia ubonensis]